MPEQVNTNKPSMELLVGQFPQQILDAVKYSSQAVEPLPPLKTPVQNIYVAGMGGSAIGADFCKYFSRAERKIPMQVGKGYTLPAWVGPHTLAIASSYSGNTEETIASLHEMIEHQAQIVVISSGGHLKKMAQEKGLVFLQLPENQPAPRAALGWSLLMQLSLLYHYRLISEKSIQQMAATTDWLKQDQEEIKQKAQHIAGFISNKIPILYSADLLEPIALRFRQQLAENANMLSSHHVFPEMNHNELVGWSAQYPQLAAIYLRNRQDEHARVSLRMEISKEIITRATSTFIELHAKGRNFIERSLYLIHLTDWASVYAAQKRQVDAMDISAINYLKQQLAFDK